MPVDSHSPEFQYPKHTEGGAIITPAKELARDINGTVERWSKGAWDHIKHLWNVSKEHLAKWFPVAHFHWTAPWIGAAGGVGAIALLGAAEIWRRHRKKKREAAQQAQK